MTRSWKHFMQVELPETHRIYRKCYIIVIYIVIGMILGYKILVISHSPTTNYSVMNQYKNHNFIIIFYITNYIYWENLRKWWLYSGMKCIKSKTGLHIKYILKSDNKNRLNLRSCEFPMHYRTSSFFTVRVRVVTYTVLYFLFLFFWYNSNIFYAHGWISTILRYLTLTSK